MVLTQKEATLIKDLKGQEQLCIDKYAKHAGCAKDPQLASLFNRIADVERGHLNTLNQIEQGSYPAGGGQPKTAMPAFTTYYTADGVTKEKPLWFFLERYMQSFATEVKGFINAIENDTDTLVGVEDGLKPVLMGIAAKKSVEEHRPVKLSEIQY